MKRPTADATIEVVCDSGTVAVVPIVASRDTSITTRWASLRIKALDADLMSERDTAKTTELEKAITALSIEYSVLSKYTAWLAVDRSRTTDSVVVRTLVQPDYSLREPITRMLFCYNSTPLSESWGSLWNSRLAPMSRSLPLFDSSVDMDSADDVGMGSIWVQTDVVLAIQMLLEQAAITSEEFNEVRDQVLIALSQMTGTAEKVAKAILKRLKQCESALAKGRESRAREHLLAIVGLFENAST